MNVIVRRNERSWAIVIISEIKGMLDKLGLRIRSVGGESTLSVNKQSMFPDLLLYGDEAQTKILQGWELKMPDVPITDAALLKDAERKARTLGLNSFVIWNFTYGKLYIKNGRDVFEEVMVWNGTDHIRTREDVTVFKDEWLPVIQEIVLAVNDFLVHGTIRTASLAEMVSDSLITELITRNKDSVAEYLKLEVSRDMRKERRLSVWWNSFHEEYDRDENNVYSAYAKSVLLNWANRIMFANMIKKYHSCASAIEKIDSGSTPAEGNAVIADIVQHGDFYNVFQKMDYNEMIPEDTWIDLVDYNRFLIENKIERIDQNVLQQILERTVHTANREIRGQYATPYELADILCQLTVRDWNADCADLCAGTGTIARAVLENKKRRLPDAEFAFRTTWMSDKYAYPLQIANIAVTSPEAFRIPLNIFQADVFGINAGDVIEIASPSDGRAIAEKIPEFGAIVSNLPFVEYNKIAEDEIPYMDRYRQRILDQTGIAFTLGKTDLYNYIPFKLYELLKDDGRLGIILSNSWLGTEIGRKFFDALLYYYKVEAVIISNCRRWFKNADVVGSLMILQKKPIAPPDPSGSISFWMLNKDIGQLQQEEKETLINSVVLDTQLDETVASVKKYSLDTILRISEKGITLNALFHDVSWMEELGGCLVSVESLLTVKRGERRGWNDLFYPSKPDEIEDEYIKPVLKNPALLKSYIAQPDICAFCCHRTKEELQRLGHTGALKWIEKFENIKNGKGKPLPEALKQSGRLWYEMDDGARADFVTALNPDRRLFVAAFGESTFVDQRFTRLLLRNKNVSGDLLHALLNSLYGMFAIEAIGFGRGLGVLDASSTRLKKMFMIDPEMISDADAAEIVALFEKVKQRGVMDVSKELRDPDREAFDRKVLRAIGQENLYDPIRDSLLSMQHTRHEVD